MSRNAKLSPSLEQRTQRNFERRVHRVYVQTDRLFLILLLGQWACAIALALFVSPYTWAGQARSVHLHVMVSVVLGAVINSAPVILILRRPGWSGTRQVVAVAQMLWSALFIHLTGGRIETHFHVFGSLAFIAFYRDWKVLPTATLVVVADHLVRGLAWPQSVYGLANPEWWRFLEHAGWVTFEDVVLVLACLRNVYELRLIGRREAELEETSERIEQKVVERTAELAASRMELAQAQKLESVGRLAAGVAHEINTPLQFVSDSVDFLDEAMRDFNPLFERYRAAREELAKDPATRALADELAQAEEEADLHFIREQATTAVAACADGLGRVRQIVGSMKDFAHPDQDTEIPVDLNHALASTLTIARNEYKYVADVETTFGDIPPVSCYAGAVNQVFLNLIINAAHAIADRQGQGSPARGRITLSTRLDGDEVVVAISDTGTGIAPGIQEKIFDPFVTTKKVGRGTGQGLAIARSVVHRHGGDLSFETEVGKGTTFFVRLPLEPAHAREEAA